MAQITKKFIHFKTKAAFNTALSNSEIPTDSITFIKDTKEIYTHGLYYDGKTIPTYVFGLDGSSLLLTATNSSNELKLEWIKRNTTTGINEVENLALPVVTTTKAGIVTAADKQKIDKVGLVNQGILTLSSLTNISMSNARLKYHETSTSKLISFNGIVALNNGSECHIIIKNTHASNSIAIAIPTDKSYVVSFMGDSLNIPANSYGEINGIVVDSKILLRGGA